MSETGARGVMQITPMMAREAFGVDPKELWRARRNIELGVGYLKHLIGQYADRWDLALSHYKSGSVLSHRTHKRVSVTAWTYVQEVLYYQKQYNYLDSMGRNVEVRGKIWAVARVITRPNGAKRSHVTQSENSDFTLGGGSDGNVSLEFSQDPAPGIETENLGDFAAAVVAALSLAFGGPLGIMAGLGYAFAIDKSPTPRDLSLFGGLIGDYIEGAVPNSDETH